MMKKTRELIEAYQLAGTQREQALVVAELEIDGNWMFEKGNKKKFKDLDFKKHPIVNGEQAIEVFKNGYGISVLKGKEIFYSNGINTYEIAFLKDAGLIETYLIEDSMVLGYLPKKYVERYMVAIQNF